MAEAKKKVTKKVKKEVGDGADQKASPKKLVTEEPEQEVVASTETQKSEKVAVAKAGKHSAKALKEAEEKEAKEARKASGETQAEAKPKPAQKPAHSRLERQGKKFRELAALIDKTKDYSLAEAIDLATKTNPAKFDATAELHIRLGVDPRQADQNIRSTVTLPAGTGKTIRVAVLAEGEQASDAKKAGADQVGVDELLAKIEKETLDFDILVATPALMAKLGKHARVLGPKGLMPNPKSGTVTNDTAKAVQEAKAGRVEFRVDSTGIVHIGFGKVSFGADKLQQNARAVLDSIKAVKPGSLKGAYVQAIYVTTSMGPSIRVAVSEA
ncbi:MAG: Ribosomal protein [Candidatus Saccharibacteria bacterium]|nr:Ribosomal protein [Candidatus Saccharibacteria bacterium]